MNLKRLSIGLAALAVLGSLAYAQVSVPRVPTGGILPTTSLIQVLPTGQPSAQSVYAYPAQISGTYGYYKGTPGAGFTYTFGANVTRAQFNPAGTLASGYVTLSAAPNDGQRDCVFTTQTITAFYVAANTGQSITSAGGFSSGVTSTALSINTQACWLYGSANQTWDRD